MRFVMKSKRRAHLLTISLAKLLWIKPSRSLQVQPQLLAMILVCCILLGRRKDPVPPHNIVLTFIGAAMLWVGWFGFNAGSAVTAGLQAGMAMLVTHMAAAVAGFTWMIVEWMTKGKPVRLNSSLVREMWRMACSLEHLPIGTRTELGDTLLKKVKAGDFKKAGISN